MTYRGMGLKAIREESVLTRQVVAKRCGISQSFLREDTVRALSEISTNGNRHAGQMPRLK